MGSLPDGPSALGNKLRDLRRRKLFSQFELSQLLRCSAHTISRWETGRTIPSNANLNDFIRILEIDESDIRLLRELTGVKEDSYVPLVSEVLTGFGDVVKHHIGALEREVSAHGELDLVRRDQVLALLRDIQEQLLSLDSGEPLGEKVAMVQYALREIDRSAPKWVMDRIKAIFSEQAFTAYMGVAIGAALTKGLG